MTARSLQPWKQLAASSSRLEELRKRLNSSWPKSQEQSTFSPSRCLLFVTTSSDRETAGVWRPHTPSVLPLPSFKLAQQIFNSGQLARLLTAYPICLQGWRDLDHSFTICRVPVYCCSSSHCRLPRLVPHSCNIDHRGSWTWPCPGNIWQRYAATHQEPDLTFGMLIRHGEHIAQRL